MADTFPIAADVTGKIARLFVYPVKSCAAVEVQEAVLTRTGLDLDRAWMVVDEQGEFVSQRELPRMALIRPQLKSLEIILRAPGMLALHLDINAVEAPTRARVWSDEVAAYDMGDVAAQWFTEFLLGGTAQGQVPPGWAGRRLRLVRFDPDFERPSSPHWTQGQPAFSQFADGFAVLLASQASLDGLNQRLTQAGHAPVTMERFRPNIVLSGLDDQDEDRIDTLHVDTPEGPTQLQPCKPCTRCPIPNIDPQTASSSPEVNDMLQTYRGNALMEGAVTFGMNAYLVTGDGHNLRVGQAVRADWKF